MRRFTEKIWGLAATICLLMTLATFVAVVEGHQVAEESSSELVDNFEEVEAITHRGERRVKRRHFPTNLLSCKTQTLKKHADAIFRSPSNHERDSHNGFGSHLRI